MITETTYDYYLMDATGKTVAIFRSKDNDQGLVGGWEYYASGAERECRPVPASTQAPTSNVGDTDVKFKKDQESFYLYDHLGNTRLNYTPTGFISHPGDPSIAVNRINSVVDYFPYGKVLRHYNVTDERYLTTQHERDQETGLDYRGARFYDGDIGRFLSLDPLAMKYPSWSDYNYVLGNPLMFIDPTGESAESTSEEESNWTSSHILLNTIFGDPSGFNEMIKTNIDSAPTGEITGSELKNIKLNTNQSFPNILKDIAKASESFNSGDYMKGGTLKTALGNNIDSKAKEAIGRISKIIFKRDGDALKLILYTKKGEDIKIDADVAIYIENGASVKLSKSDLENGDGKVVMYTKGFEATWAGLNINKITLYEMLPNIRTGFSIKLS